jgi:hypothetical protein
LLAVGAVEEGAAFGEGVDVGRMHLRESVAAELGAEVIHGDEEDVHFAGRYVLGQERLTAQRSGAGERGTEHLTA